MYKVCVYMIESPSDQDLLHARFEGRLIMEALNTIKIDHYYSLAVNKPTFIEAINMTLGLIEKKKFPFIHFSAHGTKEGIGLTDGTFIQWHELKKYIRPINDLLNGGLCIGMSSCSGWHACRMVWGFNTKLPFFGLVGPTKDIPFEDVTIAFVTFYYRLLKKRSTGRDAVEAMKIASRNECFDIILASQAKKIWDDTLRNILKNLDLLKPPSPYV